MILGFGAGADALVAWARSQQWGSVAAAGAAVAAAALLVNHDPWLQPANTNLRPQNALLKGAHDEAEAWIQAREWDRAEEVLRAAMADPWLAKKARLNLDLACVRWYGRRDLEGARELTAKSVKALLEEGSRSRPDTNFMPRSPKPKERGMSRNIGSGAWRRRTRRTRRGSPRALPNYRPRGVGAGDGDPR